MNSRHGSEIRRTAVAAQARPHPRRDCLPGHLLTLVNRIDARIIWTSIRRGEMRFQDEAREMAGVIYVVGAAGTVALVLSATGLYAVLSYVVALRRREIGVRLAIGAPPSRIIL